MSQPQIDLLKDSTKAVAKDVYKTLVAVFKEEPENPRVLADSEAYLAYTLKNGRTLRLIQRSNNTKGSLRAHTKPIHALEFVNYRSNVAASAAEKEFLVWVVTNDNALDADPAASALTVKIYFRLVDPAVTVGAFAFFMNPHVNTPDILILHGKKAAVLESSKIISRYAADELEATLAADSRELRELTQAATTKSLCAINNSGWFAFTMEPTLVAACTLRNRATPAWAGCQGAPVLSIELLEVRSPEDPNFLIAGSSVKVFQWELTGAAEPRLLRTFWMGGSVVTTLSSRGTFAVFNNKKQVALVEPAGSDAFTSTLYDIDAAVRPSSVCFNRKTSYGCVLVDAQTQVEMYQLTMGKDGKEAAGSPTTAAPAKATAVTTTSAVDADKPVAAAAAPKSYAAAAKAAVDTTTTTAVAAADAPAPTVSVARELPPPPTAAAQGKTSQHIMNLMEQVQRGNVRATPPTATPPPAAVATTTTTTTMQPPAFGSTAAVTAAAANSAAARALLQNTLLPQGTDGPLASATHASDEAVRRELEALQSISKNISQILQFTPEQIARDHEQLINLALEAQMTELQSTTGGGGGGDAASSPSSPVPLGGVSGGGVRDPNGDAFNSYVIAKVMAPVANDIAAGITTGIRATLRVELDNAIRDALGSNVREAQKRALRKRLDDALTESTTHFSAEVRKRLADFASRDLRDVLTQVNASLHALVEENRRLRTSLNDIVRCGALEQLQSTQRELAGLKEDLAAGKYTAAISGGGAGNNNDANGANMMGGNPSSFSQARPNPETILTTARAMLSGGKYREGLEYIALARQPHLTLQLLLQLKTGDDDAYHGCVAAEAVTDAVWIDVLTQASQPAALEALTGGESDVLFVAELLFDVLCEREALTESKSAKAQGLLSNIRHFVARQKHAVASAEGLRLLRDLDKSIQ